MSTDTPVAVIGAGPYGLSIAAHLAAAGIRPHVFGEPMVFWQRSMPVGMFLRSSWDASHIDDAAGELTLDAYEKHKSITLERPIPLAEFVDYGKWFQQQAVPSVDRRRIICVEPYTSGFRLSMDDATSVNVAQVVVATGLESFAWRPTPFDLLPPDRVSHASDHGNLSRFRGKIVAVIGAGQSAIESAALLNEGGAQVEVVARSSQVRWLSRSLKLHGRSGMIRRLLYPPTDVGPPGLNQVVARPDLFRKFPRELQQRIAYRSIRPAAAGWLLPRVTGIRLTLNRAVQNAEPVGSGVRLTLNDGSSRTVDHVLLGTGYRIDVSHLEFLHRDLLGRLRVHQGYPVLETGYESSVPGLYFIGAAAAVSFGPVMRFVSGTRFTGPAVTSSISQSIGRGAGKHFDSYRH
jgi:thioredoxin reductase